MAKAQGFMGGKATAPVPSPGAATLNGVASWHETFRFDTRYIDHDGWLTVELYAVDASDPANLTFDGVVGLSDEVKIHHDLAVNDQFAKVPPEKRVEAITTQSTRSNRVDDSEGHGDGVRKASSAEQTMADSMMNRRRLAMLNARLQLSLGKLADVPENPIPADQGHIPLGFVFLPFAHLREATLSANPVRIDRPLRANVRGRVAFDLDFRPRLWSSATDRLRELDDPYFASQGVVSMRAAALDVP